MTDNGNICHSIDISSAGGNKIKDIHSDCNDNDLENNDTALVM